MSALQRFIHRARLRRSAKLQRQASRRVPSSKSAVFVIETLEPRVLLSGDVLSPPMIGDLAAAAGPSAIVSIFAPGRIEASPRVVSTEGFDSPFTIAPQLLDDEAPIRLSDANGKPTDDSAFTLAPQLADPPPPPLVVTSFGQTATGFSMRFNRAIDAGTISLYDVEAGTLGAADVTLFGATFGDIKGSLIVAGDLLTFVAHGGVIAPDTYSVTLRSASNGIKDPSGNLLDGDNNGTAGGNYINSFTVGSSTAVVVSIADFARGPGQVVNISGSDNGIPITVSDGTGVTSLNLTLRYDTSLLTIKSALASADLPVGANITADLSQPGVVNISMTASATLGMGAKTLFRLTAEVLHTAGYGKSALLDIASVSVNNGGIAALADDGVQVVAYFGETTGNRGYSALDGQRALRVAAGLDTGFAAYPAIDPSIIADITGNGAISALDGTRILQDVAGLDRAEIQPITPVILSSLVNDSGLSAADSVTNDPHIAGTVSDDGTISAFRVGLDNNPLFFDASADLLNGTFNLRRARLEQLIGQSLSDGAHTLHLRARDNGDNLSTVADFAFSLDTLAPAPVLLQLISSSDTGVSASDGLTADATPTVRITAEAGALVRLLANGVEIVQGTTGNGTLELVLPSLADGPQTLTAIAVDRAGNSAASSAALSVTIDTAGPGLQVTSPGGGGVITPQAHLIGSVTATSLRTLQYRFDNQALRSIAVAPAGTFDQALSVGGLGNGAHVLTVLATDLAGNVTSVNVNVQLTGMPFRLTAVSPFDGAGNVGVSVQPKIIFSEPVNPATVTSATFFASAGGAVLPSSLLVDASGTFARLFFAQPLPGSSTIEITVNGSAMTSLATGASLDADDNGTAGGELKFSFTTVSTSAVFGTSLVGRIADAGPDMIPMTADDTLPGADNLLGTADDILLLPVSGARVFAGGLENFAVFSNASGNFVVDKTLGGDVKVSVQGEPASAPAGFTFPELVLDVSAISGVTNQLGTIYLPRLATSTVQTVNNTQGMTITLPPQGAMGLTEEQRQQFTLEIAPASLLGSNGQPVTTGQIAVSLVPNEFLRAMLPATLPPALLSFALQARGFSDFAHPLRMTLPNVSDAPVGTEFVMMSFDPSTGQLFEDGIATVVASAAPGAALSPGATAAPGLGTIVSWDPGDDGGLTACFHILLATGAFGFGGGGSGSGVSSVRPVDCDPLVTATVFVLPVFLDNNTFQDRFFDSDNGSFDLHFENAALVLAPDSPVCSVQNQQASPLKVDIAFEQPEGAPFVDGLESQSFYLFPQETKDISVLMRRILNPEDLDPAVANRLLGATINLRGTVLNPETGNVTVLFDQKVFVYRLWDISDNDHIDRTLEFERTTVDGDDGVERDKKLQLVMPFEARPTLTVNGAGFAYSENFSQLTFDPQSVGVLGGGLKILSPNDEAVGTILLQGQGVAKTNIVFSRSSFLNSVALVVDANAITNSKWSDFRALFPDDANGNGLRSDEAGFQSVANTLYGQIAANVESRFAFDPQVAATVNVTESGAGVQINSFLSLPGNGDANIAESPHVDFNRGGFNNLVSNQKNTSTPQEEFLLASFVNLSAVDLSAKGYQGVALFIGAMAENLGATAFLNFVNLVANSIAHEVGHDLGNIHTRSVDQAYIYGTDVMGSASPEFPQIFGDQYRGLVKSAVGIPMTEGEFSAALEYYKAYVNLETFPFSVPAHRFGELGLVSKLLTVLDAPVAVGQPTPHPVSQIDFGAINADGVGGQSGTRTLVLFNNGTQDLTVSSIALQKGNAGFSIEGIGNLPLTLPAINPGNIQPALSQRTITLRYDPSAAGAAQDTLRIVSDSLSGAVMEIPLSGLGISPLGDLRLEIANNNLGGISVGGGAVSRSNIATLRNTGAAALTINTIAINDGAGQFAVTGLPAGPIVLAPNGTVSFGVSFDAQSVGLQRAHLEIASNDLDTPLLRQTLVGTGLADGGSGLDYGNDYVAVQLLRPENSAVQRQVSDGGGNWNLFLSGGTPYRHAIFDPVSSLIESGTEITATGGQSETHLSLFGASTAHDSDGDGLPDDVEFAIGSSVGQTDTDGDGVDDLTEIALGFSPLDGVAGNTGIVAALALPGEAFGIAVAGDIAYVATGSHGIALVNIADPTKPLLLSSKDLPGSNFSVAIDEARMLAAVTDASATAGLHIVNIANVSNPAIVRTVPLAQPATHVEVLDGIAYVASGTALVSIELQTGNIMQTLNLGGVTLTGLAREGALLVTMDGANHVSTVEISGQTIQLRDNLTVSHGGGAAFVGGGIAYFSNESGLRGGFSTVNVADPANITLISDSDVSSGIRPEEVVAVDSSGRALIGGNAPNPQNPLLSIPVIDVANVSDPANTNAYLTRFVLPEFPLGVVLASGVALIADGSSDLQVIKYRSPDTAAVAPSVAIQALVADLDPAAPGIQVSGGSKLQIRANASDDVLVRKVELLVNGSVVSTDPSFPYEGQIGAPASGSFTVQARATDIGSNIGLSNLLTFQVNSDTAAPSIVSINPANGASLAEGLQKVTIRFSEALAASTVTTATFRVTLGGQTVTPAGIALLSGGTLVELSYASLNAGAYQLVIGGSAVTDLAGNSLAAGNVTSNFTLTTDAIEWINPAGGFWDVASNWEGGVLPGVNDNVLIDVPGSATITFRSGTSVVNKFTSRESFAITGGVLQVNTTAQVDGNFTIGNGGTLRNATILPGAGGQDLHITSFAILDHVTAQGNLTIDDQGTGQIENGLTLANSRVTLASTGSVTLLSFGSDQTLGGTGEVFFGGSSANNRNAVDGNGTFTIGSGITIRGTKSGSVGTSFTDETVIFEGTIIADRSGETIILGGLDTQIRGLVRATNGGTAALDDTFSFQAGGSFQASGGNVVITGTLDNTGKTLALTPATGSLLSNNGTIKGGRIETSGGAALVPQFTVTLDGVTLGSNYTVPDGTDTLVRNGLTLDNVNVTFIDGTIGFVPARMRFLDDSTLGGTGEVIFAGTGDANQLTGASGFTFTIGPNITVHGTRGGDVGLSGNLTILGTISSETNLREITITAGTLLNQGSLKAINGGDLLLSGAFATTGSIDIGGSDSQLRLLSGTILQNSGATRIAGGTLRGTTISLQGGTLTGSGVVNGALINNASITVGGSNSAGNLQVLGAYTQTATGVLNLEVGGAIAATQFDRLQITGAASLAGTLNESLINNFSPANGQNFAVVTFTSHGATTFNTINGLNIGGGRVFNPIYNATNLTLNVAPSPAPPNNEAPLLTNDTTVESASGPLGGLTLDLEQSAELSRQTGKEWLFYTE